MIVYGYLLLRGAQLLSNGSELLLEVISPGIIGGSLPIFFETYGLYQPASTNVPHPLPASRVHAPVSVQLFLPWRCSFLLD